MQKPGQKMLWKEIQTPRVPCTFIDVLGHDRSLAVWYDSYGYSSAM